MTQMLRAALVISLVFILSACASITGRTAGQSIDDARITASINTKLVQEPTLSAFKIDVDSFEGHVTLTGQVPSREAEQRMISLARETQGVKSVTSNVIIQPPQSRTPDRAPSGAGSTRGGSSQ
ncbi:MAG: BON domain-containing protein [Alphaproteobacteria bacterium]|uniref:BON domain-containing protein n=1 Tax=Candidatus Nitrobium versatile TaxID=2884831 RepID=A0A953M0D0_9BACT|nr:BON domain-containing protein [Candidatus Nitrobium versatile]